LYNALIYPTIKAFLFNFVTRRVCLWARIRPSKN